MSTADVEQRLKTLYTVEGMSYSLVTDDVVGDGEDAVGEVGGTIVTLAAAGEAAVNGIVLQAVADSAALQDDYGTSRDRNETALRFGHFLSAFVPTVNDSSHSLLRIVIRTQHIYIFTELQLRRGALWLRC